MIDETRKAVGGWSEASVITSYSIHYTKLYDLVKRFTGQEVPATGVSVGVDRLLAALRAKGRIGGTAQGPVVVTVMDRDRMGDYLAMASELRRAGIRARITSYNVCYTKLLRIRSLDSLYCHISAAILRRDSSWK